MVHLGFYTSVAFVISKLSFSGPLRSESQRGQAVPHPRAQAISRLRGEEAAVHHQGVCSQALHSIQEGNYLIQSKYAEYRSTIKVQKATTC